MQCFVIGTMTIVTQMIIAITVVVVMMVGSRVVKSFKKIVGISFLVSNP